MAIGWGAFSGDQKESSLSEQFYSVRSLTESLSAPLSDEDQLVQSMADVSPTKWHRAHTSWFFETFVLCEHLPGYVVFSEGYQQLFNSYYNSVSSLFPRDKRGLLSRPSAPEVSAYRRHVDKAMGALLEEDTSESLQRLIVLGLQHENQHQELILTDIKHVLSQSPLLGKYQEFTQGTLCVDTKGGLFEFVGFEGGRFSMGHQGAGFRFDNELPCHQILLNDFELAARPLNNGDVLAFIEGGGYKDPLLWLSDGWAWKNKNQAQHPLYWQKDAPGAYRQFTMGGMQELTKAETACHLNYFEVDALARFFGLRLPTEQEWECAAGRMPRDEQIFDPMNIRPKTPSGADNKRDLGELRQMMGGVWEWTQSPYVAYPGYHAPPGAVGEYNGKFMHNQMVLRGGSCASPPGHVRATYRNFFPAHAQWQFTGARLARSLGEA